MGSDLFLVFIWWVYMFIIGIVFLPLARRIFNSFFDKGYIFSKVLGIAAVSYFVWLLSSIRLMPFYRICLFITLILAFIVNYILLKGYKGFKDFIIENKRVFISEEIIFFAGIAAWSYIRGLQPDINGLEKFMDFGFVNAILRSKYMPPVDMWFAGSTINYYYYGHYICAFLTRLSCIDSAVTYNLMIATIFSFALTLSFSLGGNMLYILKKYGIKKVIMAGVISSLLLAFGGNLHTAVYAYGLPFAKSIGLYQGKVETYSYPEATRYIGYNPPTNDKTIHEFPIYSFVVSDLHGHVSDIPFVLTILAVLLTCIAEENKKKLIALIGFLLAICDMTNTWDYIIYFTVALFVILYINYKKEGFGKKLFVSTLYDMVKIFLVSQLFAIPYTLNFKNITGGVGIVHAQTPFYQILVLWGYQLFFALCFAVFLYYKYVMAKRQGKNYTISTADVFTLILLISAAGLVLMPEVVYVRDIYGETYHRANTMFKLTYQAFMMFAVSIGFILVRVVTGTERKYLKNILAVVFGIVIVLPMLYPSFAIRGYYGQISISNYKGLYGLNFLKTQRKDDYGAVKWLEKNVEGQEVVLEANGDSYTDYDRISMATGLPTVLGWFGHEWLWRGGPEMPTKRAQDVQTIYESGDDEATRLVLQEYNVEYIVIGSLEKEKYKNLNEEKLLRMGKVVYDSQGTRIIKLEKQ